MKRTFQQVLLCAAIAFAGNAHAIDVAGVKVDDTITAANTTLKLNGAGIRTKVFFKVYVASLYTTDPKTTTEAILAVPGPKQVNLTMLRDVSSDDLGSAFMAGVRKNTDKADLAKLTNQLINFGQLFSTVPELKKGDVISIEWVPADGSIMMINGKKIGSTFPDQAFFNAILKIWIGENPVDGALKTKLLGGK